MTAIFSNMLPTSLSCAEKGDSFPPPPLSSQFCPQLQIPAPRACQKIFSHMEWVVHLFCPHCGSTKPPLNWEDIFFVKNDNTNWHLWHFEHLPILSQFGTCKLELSPEAKGDKKITCNCLCNKVRNAVQVPLVFSSVVQAG